MSVDLKARSRYAEEQKTKKLLDGMKESVAEMTKQKEDPQVEGLMNAPFKEVLRLAAKKDTEKEISSMLGKIGNALAMIYKSVNRPIVLPKIFQIRGEVEVLRQSPVAVTNLPELKKYFDSLEETIKKMYLAIQAMPQPQIKLPKFEIPTQIKADNPKLTELLEKLNSTIDNLQPGEMPSMSRTNELLESIATRPQMTPQPVTNVWTNPAQGFIKTSTTTVGTTLTPLPAYGRLFNRRAIAIYNNSSNTIYVGGSDVTTSNGIPVSSSNYGLTLDAGYDCILYAIASTTGNDIRVLEISKDQVGDSPQE